MEVFLKDICEFEKGSTGLAKSIPGEYPLVATSVERRSCDSFQFDTKAVCVPLVSSTGHGHASLKNVHYQEGKFALGSILVALTAINEETLDIQFLHLYLSELKDKILVPLMSGAANVALSVAKIKNIKIPLPSIARQQEIVVQFKSIVSEEKELTAELTHQQTLLKKLRQQILQKAIEGKLTKDWRVDNPDVEPASELIKRIQTEKEQLIKDKKIRSQKPLPAIGEEEKPFILPDGWAWCRLGDICTKITDGFHNTPPKVADGFPYIAATHVKSGKIDWASIHYVSEEFHRELYAKAYPQKGEILLVNIGAGCGTPAIIDVDFEFSFKNTAILKFNQEYVLNTYLFNYFVLNKEIIYRDLTKGGLQPFLSLKILNRINMPFPPLPEQKAIVTKVEKLLTLCDQLETQIISNQTHAKQLMQAVLKEAFLQQDKTAEQVTANT